MTVAQLAQLARLYGWSGVGARATQLEMTKTRLLRVLTPPVPDLLLGPSASGDGGPARAGKAPLRGGGGGGGER